MGEYWYLWLAFAVLVIVTAVVIVFAGKAVSSHNEETKRILAELDRLKALKDKYKDLTPEKVESAESKELLDGVNAVLQAKIEKAEDDKVDAEFASFNSAQKNVYALSLFIAEACENLSSYFEDFNIEFSEILLSALEAVGAKDILALAEKEFAMFDEKNENVSLDKGLIEKTDKEFAEIYSEKRLLDQIKAYIKDNIDKF